MDSFYEQPRTAPVPTSTERIAAVPVVPEVSMIFQNNSKDNSPSVDSMYLSYNAWKSRNQNDNTTHLNYYGNALQSRMQGNGQGYMMPEGVTKQVRFQGPTVMDQQKGLLLENTNARFPSKLHASVSAEHNFEDANIPEKLSKSTKPFEQIYMANIPNRHLDLSIIEPPKTTFGRKENIENVSPNVNLGSVQPQTRDYLYNSKEMTNVSSKRYSVNNENKFNSLEYTKKYDGCIEAPSTRFRGDLISDLHKVDERNDLLEKHKVIDLYNYKRDDIKPSSAYANRQTLDNSKLTCNSYSRPRLFDTQREQLHPKPNMYESFDSHNCESNKRLCSCTNNKLQEESTKNNAALQTELGTTNSCKSLEVDVVKSSDDPTVKDLLKIIHQQNDQLLILQKQVAALLNNRDAPKQIEAPPALDRNVNLFGEKCRTSTQLETQPALQKSLPRKGPLPQFSLDVMTSFEVSIRRQQNLNRAYKDNINHQPKICEVTETDSNVFDHSHNLPNGNNIGNILSGICNKGKARDNTDVSFTLNEPLHVPETCPTPDHTVRIDMDDYSSDSDDETAPHAGWLYNNMKGQVNHILRKSGIWPNNDSSTASEPSNDIVSQNVRKKVKEATIKHLKSIGVHVPALDDAEELVETDLPQGYNSNEVSFAVKQLLMKYLPNEQLAKLAYMQTQNIIPQQCDEQAGLIKRRPEFSFATVQYMQKYNLLTDVPNGRNANHVPQMAPVVRQDENFDRILDASAIRQQPKLL